MPNRLADETSPYLLQHQHNPVDWFPWGEAAFAEARARDRPILLSVGYSACHWCHVMERESFEDEATAAQMNALFVNVKVDREERPDVDEIYMSAVQAFTGGRGGWPMTLFLTPDGRPFMGGTYFPPVSRRGMPSFSELMAHVDRVWREDRAAVDAVTEEVVDRIRAVSRMPAPADALEGRWLDAVVAEAEETFDASWAGFGRAPKFPPHGTLSVLLAAASAGGRPVARRMALDTLDAMARGGMYDVLGGGFARYSVDERWCVPHFEKMLYDNALLVPVYLDAHALTGEPRFARVARETLEYLAREMRGPDGGFTAAQDADSEGEEGRFFVWTPAELDAVLGPEDGAFAAALFGVTADGSFEHGRSVIRMERPPETLDAGERSRFESVRRRLFDARSARVAPGRDDKIITAWNGLAVSAFARGAEQLGDEGWAQLAASTARFLLERLVDAEGRLLRSYKDGRARFRGCLDDHAFLLSALIDLFQATQERDWLERALVLADRTVAEFWDEAEGGLFYTAHDAEPLVARSKNLLGGALPSANGAAAHAFQRLSVLVGREDLGERAERILRAYQPLLERAARALGPEALAGAWRSGGGQEIGVVGAPEDPRTQALWRELTRRHLPFSVRARLSPGEDPGPLEWMRGRDLVDGAPSAWVCRDHACLAPITDPAELGAALDALTRPLETRDPGLGRVRAPALPSRPEDWLNVDAPLSLEQLRGRVVVLDFWTYCCINCLHVLPELAAVEAELADAPVSVIGVHAAKFPAERSRENVARALVRHRVHHPVVLDPEHTLWERFAVKAWPTIVVLDRGGRVAWTKAGEIDRAELLRVVRRTLEEPSTLDPSALPPVTATVPERGALRFPGKLGVWSGDPGGAGAPARLYVADSGHHRVIEAALELGEDGWPRARLERVFGDGRPGRVDGPAESARFHGPQGVSRRGARLWVADTEGHALRTIDLDTGRVDTRAGTGRRGGGGRIDPSDPRRLDLRSPWDVAAIDGGALVAMAGTHQIWVYLEAHGRFGPLIGSGAEAHVDGDADRAALAQPSGLALSGSHLFFVDAETSSVRLVDLEAHEVATVVGRGLFDFGDVDGAGEAVRLQHPLGLAVSEGRWIWVADTFNHKLKRIDLQGAVTTTVVGGDGTLLEPADAAVFGRFLLVADTGHHRLVTVDPEQGALRVLDIDGLEPPRPA